MFTHTESLIYCKENYISMCMISKIIVINIVQKYHVFIIFTISCNIFMCTWRYRVAAFESYEPLQNFNLFI